MSQIKEAMRKAGADTRPPSERLEEICINAMVRHATDTEKVLLEIWKNVRDDHALTLALLQSEWRRCASALIYRTRDRLAYMEGQKTDKSPTIQKAIKVNKAWSIRDKEAENAIRRDEQRQQAKADKEWRGHIAFWTKTAAAHVKVNDKPFWEASVGQIQSGIADRGRETRFLAQLIHGVPNDGRPISFYRKPDEINEIWQRTEKP